MSVPYYSDSEQNHTRYDNPQVDGLLGEARSETDYEKRLELYHQAVDIIVNVAPWIPIYCGITYLLVRLCVEGPNITSQGEYDNMDSRLVDGS